MAETLQHNRPFTVGETHGILRRPEHRIIARSDDLGWTSIYASLQREQPYTDDFEAVNDHLVILHLGGPVGVRRRLAKREERRVVPPGGLFILPGGAEFGVQLEGELDSLHIYLRRELVQEVAEDLGIKSGGSVILPSLGEPDLLAEQLALGVRDALLAGDAATDVYVDYLSRALAARLLRKHGPGSTRGETARRGLTPQQLRATIDFIEANLDRSISLSEMAAACDLSPSHFARRFKLAGQSEPRPLRHRRTFPAQRPQRLARTAPGIFKDAHRLDRGDPAVDDRSAVDEVQADRAPLAEFDRAGRKPLRQARGVRQKRPDHFRRMIDISPHDALHLAGSARKYGPIFVQFRHQLPILSCRPIRAASRKKRSEGRPGSISADGLSAG